MAAMRIVRATVLIGEGAESVGAVARNVTAVANMVKGAAGDVADAVRATHGACRAIAIALGALACVGGAAYAWYKKGRAVLRYLLSPATPAPLTIERHDVQREQGQEVEWSAMRRRNTRENRRLTRSQP